PLDSALPLRRERDEAGGVDASLQLDVAHRGVPDRRERRVPRRERGVQDDGRRRALGGDQSRLDAQREGQAGHERRPDRVRHLGRRDLQHDPHREPRADRRQRDLGRHRRRPRAGDARRRQDVDERRRPYVYKTSDYGKTWTDISKGLPQDVPARVVREDPNARGLLVLGTDAALWYSRDGGATWKPLKADFTTVPVYDLQFIKRSHD